MVIFDIFPLLYKEGWHVLMPGWYLINCKGRFETCPYETHHIPSRPCGPQLLVKGGKPPPAPAA